MDQNASMSDASTTAGASASGRTRRRRVARVLYAAIGALWAATAYWHTEKPLPEGLRVESPVYSVPLSDVRYITDITTADAYSRPVVRQAIFDETLRLIRSAQDFLVVDYFLFNDQQGRLDGPALPLRPLSSELRDALIERKKAVPTLRILLITDPINTVYGSVPSPDLAALREAGIDVCITDLDRLRDSNFIYSALWRLLFGWWDQDSSGRGWLPNPFEENAEAVTLRSWARLINFKANHRKVIIGDDGDGGLVGIITSANPHDASSAHSNVAIKLRGPVLHPLLASEIAIARFSGWRGVLGAPPPPSSGIAENGGASANGARVQILTEGAIRDELLEQIGNTRRGDSIDIAMFYIADRGVIEGLLDAARRGVNIRLILDPNKDAFGRTKSGVPNRPAASELVAASDGAIRVRWYRTHGEQFHTKLVVIYDDDRLWFTLGSANLTRRNIDDYNLEANAAVEVSRSSDLAAQVLNYFNTLWDNRAPVGIEYTADFGVYSDPSQMRYWQYRLMEATGLSTF